jgi:hypothetical protein
MLDTLMVLYIKGFRKPRLRTLIIVLLVGMGVCTILLLIANGGLKWPEISATASSVPNKDHKPAFTPTPPASSVPSIMQNICLASPTPVVTATAKPSYTFSRVHNRTPTPIDTPSGLMPDQNPLPFDGNFNPLLPRQIFTGNAALNPPENCLSNHLATPANKGVISALGPLFWQLLSVVGLLIACGLGLFGIGSRRKQQAE